jgi:cytochrome P450
MPAVVRPPEPFMPKPLGALWLQRDPIGFFQRLRQRYGDVFVLSFGTGLRRNAWVCDPALCAQIVAAGPEELEAADANAILRPVVGSGSMLLLAADDHAERRAVLAKEFDPGHLTADASMIADIAASRLRSWRVGTHVNLWDWVHAVTMDIMLEVVFGLAPAPRGEALAAALSELVDLSGSLPIFFPALRVDLGRLSSWGRFLRSRAKVERLIGRRIVERRSGLGEGRLDDIVSLAIRARYPDGRALSDSDIVDEAITLMIAGKETAAGGLAWAIELLLRNRSELERVRTDLRSQSRERLRAAVYEALRLRVPLFGIGRDAVEDYRLGRYTIPAGTAVAIPLLLVFHSPELFSEPTLFRPQRYIDERAKWPDWVPFGGGFRQCIGWNFAPMLIELVLGEIIERFDLKLIDESSERMQLRAGAFVVPNREVKVVVTAQHAPAEMACNPAAPGSR